MGNEGETHAQPMRTKAIRHVEAAATMSEAGAAIEAFKHLPFLSG